MHLHTLTGPPVPTSTRLFGRARNLGSALSRSLALGLSLGLLSTAALSQAEPQSSSFVLHQHTINNGGETTTSASYVVDASVAQQATVGETTSTSYVVQSGFWTGLSARRVLRVEGAGTGDGTVTGVGITCTVVTGTASGDCTQTFLDGDIVELVADAAASNQFDGWEGCDSTSTTTDTGDTCVLEIDDGRTITATFTLQGTIGNRVWRDVNGNGVQEASEPGLNGVGVRLDDGAGYSVGDVTSSDGDYSFVDVPPGTYTVSIDTSSLPAGVVPSFDADGIATSHAAVVMLTSGQDLDTADFGYQPQIDLAITKEDDVDPLPGGQTLTYTITVHNLGPGIATSVQVTDNLPTGTQLVETVGCAQDPVGAPVCSLGTLQIGGSASYTLEVSIDPAPPSSITNTASASATEVDIATGNNSDSESTALDAMPPTVIAVAVGPTTDDGVLMPCETVHGQRIERMLVAFDEPMFDPAGDRSIDDVTNPAGWRLISAGPDVELQTTVCSAVAGDDEVIDIVDIVYDGANDVAVLELSSGLSPGLHRLLACGDGASVLVDLGGTPLDGDEDGFAGDDFSLRFRADPNNLLANGHFDCSLEGWTVTEEDADEIAYSTNDVDGSANSGSATIEELADQPMFGLSQCVPVDALSGQVELQMLGAVRLIQAASSPGVTLTLGCQFFSGQTCDSNPLSSQVSASTLLQASDVGPWNDYGLDLTVPAGSRSAACMVGTTGRDFEADIDDIRLMTPEGFGLIFADGFETGDTEAWMSAP